MADSEAEQAAVAILPKLSSFLSMVGSVWIIVEVASHPMKRQQAYHRILFFMSTYDILESIWNFASTWPIPEDTDGVWKPRGSTKTCTTQGFFLQFGLAIPIYNAWLSVYYFLLICRSMTEQQIQNSPWECCMHASAFLIAFSTAFASIFLDLYNSANLWCWIAPLPSGCDKDSTVECERGDHAHIYRWAFYFGPLWTCLVLAFTFVVAIYLKVRSLEVEKPPASMLSTRQHDDISNPNFFDNDENAKDGTESGSIRRRARFEDLHDESVLEAQDVPNDNGFGENTPHQRMGRLNHRNTQQVLHQCLWYLAAFYMTHLFSTINRILQIVQDDTYFPLLVLHAWFDPLQGFLNFLVYRRPIFMRYRRLRSDLPRYKCWYLAFRWHFVCDLEKEQTDVVIFRNRMRREQLRELHLRKRAEYLLQHADPQPEDLNDKDAAPAAPAASPPEEEKPVPSQEQGLPSRGEEKSVPPPSQEEEKSVPSQEQAPPSQEHLRQSNEINDSGVT